MSNSNISVKGARVNNLKDINVEIPRGKLVVISGLSGSGKSSLAFDTLYAEGQRRYVESLSAYARQFLVRMSKPECDYIKGIPPAIAIEQRVNTHNTRSTVGTSTELYEYIRMLFARVGKTISPVSGEEVKKHNVNDVVDWSLSFPVDTRLSISTPVIHPIGRDIRQQLGILQKEGYTRLYADGDICRIQEVLDSEQMPASVELLVDRLVVSVAEATRSRLADSVETAFFEGRDICRVRAYTPDGVEMREFSKKFEADGVTFTEPTERMFNFNNPVGACSTCGGFGKVMGIDESLVVPNRNLSVYEGAVACWSGDVMGEWLKAFIRDSNAYDFPIHRPYDKLTADERNLLWNGRDELRGINAFFAFVLENTYKIQFRVLLSRYRGKTICPVCNGSRLKKEAMYVKVGGADILNLVTLPVSELKVFFDRLSLSDGDALIAHRLLIEINRRLQLLLDVGLGYLTLDRLSSTLSGGESQRINLVTSLGSSLVGSLYILDEPSIGLHSRDTGLLIQVLRRLKDLGNTVVVVEHDEEIIRAADHVIDIGPLAGRLGGQVVYEGDVADFKGETLSFTLRYLSGEFKIKVPTHRRKWNSYISVSRAMRNNLKCIDVRFPLNIMTVVTGVSGSGKSTLVRDILYESMRQWLDSVAQLDGLPSALGGDVSSIHAIEFVDQHSIGKSSRSNPVTYIGAYDDIRKLFAEQMLSRQMGFTPAHFSFNKEGGRCEECKGEGYVVVEMQFMADISLLCDVCHGKRFRSEVLEVEYHGVNINDMLEMTVNQAIEFMEQWNGSYEKKIIKRLKPLRDVGLGYIKLGQPSSTLSGGENQRVKLAYFLAQEQQEQTLFIFDEPTTGLHIHDIKTLLKALDALIGNGHTVVVIEHNMDVIKSADYIIDLGPEGGDEGGSVVCTGTPEEVSKCKASHTGRFLKAKLSNRSPRTRKDAHKTPDC
ncbi:MAG: excinuclease ABC subunit UvrA [Tannerellaceae bacterium]|jgi:excinuclease ABC subunit A|nr:excinuclease ABC subunit UvrA [Tannerellaceae bacterium]